MTPLEKKIREEIGLALKTRCGFEVRDVDIQEKKVKILARLPQERTKDFLRIVEPLLTASATASWKVDVSKHYFLKDGSLVYAWRLLIQAPSIPEALPFIRAVINKVPLPEAPAETVVALNAPPNWNGKRATPVVG